MSLPDVIVVGGFEKNDMRPSGRKTHGVELVGQKANILPEVDILT